MARLDQPFGQIAANESRATCYERPHLAILCLRLLRFLAREHDLFFDSVDPSLFQTYPHLRLHFLRSEGIIAPMPAGFGPIAGLKIGHAQDERALTGCTVLLFDPANAPSGAEQGIVAACEVRGGAAGERELASLRPGHLVGRVHALVFAGRGALCLEGGTGGVRWWEERGIGLDNRVGPLPPLPP